VAQAQGDGVSDETTPSTKPKSRRGGARPGAGHPITRISSRLQVEEAREQGRRALAKVLRFWARTIDDPEATWQQKHRAAQELADRCGLARRYEQDSSVAVTAIALDPAQFVADVRGRMLALQSHYGQPIERLLAAGDDESRRD